MASPHEASRALIVGTGTLLIQALMNKNDISVSDLLDIVRHVRH